MRARLTFPLVALLAALVAAAGPAAAQEDPAGTAFITPFPPNDTYNVVVVGATGGVMLVVLVLSEISRSCSYSMPATVR